MKTDLQQLAVDANSCVRCGLCIPQCPTWQISGNEAFSPRGRIVAMAAVASSQRPADVEKVLDSCLGCGICETVCPSHVPYLSMLGPAKQAAQVSKPWLTSFLQKLASMPARNFVLRTLLAAGKFVRVLALPWPSSIRNALAALPQLRSAHKAGIAVSSTATPVFVFAGCFGKTLDNPAQQAGKLLLAAAGYRPIEPAGQVCCGALAEHAGNMEQAHKLTRANLQAFAGSEPIAATASGCAAPLAAGGLGDRVCDASELIVQNFSKLPAPKITAALRIVMHVPCSLQRMPRAQAACISLLAKLPGCEVRIVGTGSCCGAGGLTHLSYPEQAKQLSAKIADQMLLAAKDAPGAVQYASANHSCAHNIEHALARRNITATVKHPLEICAQRVLG